MTLSGHLSVGHIKQEFYDAQNLDMKWKLAGATPDLAHLGGTASLKQGAGKLTDVEKLAERSRTARIALLPIITLQKIDRNGLLKKLGLPSLQSIPFDGIHGDYFFQSGTMNVKTFELAGRDMNVSTLGTIGLAGEQLLNLRITTKLMHGGIVGGTLGELITDESGRPMLTFTVQGPAVDPQIRLDMREAGRKAVQKVGEQIFKGLGLGGTNAAAPSNETAPSQAPAPPNQLQNPAQDIQKALKNIFH
jgi:hypothetical protein